MKTLLTLLFYLFFVFSSGFICNESSYEETSKKIPLDKDVYTYWKNNKAEISNYELKQLRYGELRKGNAVMIFVTEPFLPESHVKYDGIQTNEKFTEVLKLNFERHFLTGIYPYSLMTSVFTPFSAEPSHPYKVSTSCQEWCGQTFLQLNNRQNFFEINSFSYFQERGDEKIKLDKSYLEDEIWNIIRLDINSLPIGNIDIVPSMQYSRLTNTLPKIQSASTSLDLIIDEEENNEVYLYNIKYKDINRTLIIYFEKELPRKILGWKEAERTINSDEVKYEFITEAKLIKTINTDYWNNNTNSDTIYRKTLGL